MVASFLCVLSVCVHQCVTDSWRRPVVEPIALQRLCLQLLQVDLLRPLPQVVEPSSGRSIKGNAPTHLRSMQAPPAAREGNRRNLIIINVVGMYDELRCEFN